MSMVDAIRPLQGGGHTQKRGQRKLSGCTGQQPTTAVCTGMDGSSQMFPNTGTSNSFLSTFPTLNTSDNGVGKIDYHPNDKNSFNGMFFYGHYNSTGEDHAVRRKYSRPTMRPFAPLRSPSSWVYTPNSNVVNEVRFGYDRTTFDFVNIDVNATAPAPMASTRE